MCFKKTIFLLFCSYCNCNCNGCTKDNNDNDIFSVVLDKHCKQNEEYKNIEQILKPVLIIINYFLQHKSSLKSDNKTITSIINYISEQNDKNFKLMFDTLLEDDSLKLDKNIDSGKVNRINILEKLIENLNKSVKTNKKSSAYTHDIYINNKNVKVTYITIPIKLKDNEDITSNINAFFDKNKYVILKNFCSDSLLLDVILNTPKNITIKKNTIFVKNSRKNHVFVYRYKYFMLENGELFDANNFKELKKKELKRLFIISDFNTNTQHDTESNSNEYQL